MDEKSIKRATTTYKTTKYKVQQLWTGIDKKNMDLIIIWSRKCLGPCEPLITWNLRANQSFGCADPNGSLPMVWLSRIGVWPMVDGGQFKIHLEQSESTPWGLIAPHGRYISYVPRPASGCIQVPEAHPMHWHWTQGWAVVSAWCSPICVCLEMVERDVESAFCW